MDKFIKVKKVPNPKVVTSSSKKKKPETQNFPDFQTFCQGLGSWQSLLSKYTTTKKFSNLYTKVKDAYEETVCYPPHGQIFNCFLTSNLEDIKVVVVGQDPYHQPNQAMGLCFSVNKGIKVPPSLKNIYKCIEEDPHIIDFSKPGHGDLTNWANQGVLLLNTVLTVEDSQPNSHSKFGWLEFTNKVIEIISSELDGIIFLLWGKPAEQKKKLIDLKKHHVLCSSHPSPFSARRGFLTCGHFSKVNEILEEKGKKKIDWGKICE